MGSKAEGEASSTLTLPLFAKPHIEPVHYYFQESPLQTSATIPFRWEEEPGKPRKCTSSLSKPIQDISNPDKSLELPPRLLLLDANVTKLHSPTTFLDGPYISGKSKFQSSSFRIIRRDWFFGSFRKGSTSPEQENFGSKRGVNEKGLFGSFGFGRKVYQSGEDAVGYTYELPSFMEGEGEGGNDEEGVKIRRIRIAGSFSVLSHKTRSHFWVTIYEGLKQVIPWRSRKLKKDEFVV